MRLGIREAHVHFSVVVRAVLDADSSGAHVAGQAAAAVNFHAITGGNVPVDRPSYDHFAGLHVRPDNGVTSNVYVAIAQLNRAFDLASDVVRVRAADLYL